MTEIKQTEAYLQGKLDPPEALLFEAKLLTSPWLRLNLQFQKKAYALLQLYHRKQLKAEAAAVHERLFQDPEKHDFQQKIFQMFKPKQR